MLDSRSRLIEQIQLGEDSELELKEVRFSCSKIKGPSRDHLADEIAAFANARGGTLVLGIGDKNREVVGIPLDLMDVVERYVSELAHDSIDPPVLIHVTRLMLPDSLGSLKSVIKVDVHASIFVHRSPSGYFVRVGSAKRQMAPDHLARLFQHRSQSRLIRFDESAVPDTDLSHLDIGLTSRFFTSRTDDSFDVMVQKLGISAVDINDLRRLSVAGVLLCTSRPDRWMPHAFVQAVAYSGVTIGDSLGSAMYELDSEDATGPLDRQVQRVCAFVERNQRVAARKTSGRVDFPAFDVTAVFEAVVNAVAHRDYSLYQSKIRLHMYADRLELYVPGQLVNSMSPDVLRHRQATRNEVITGLLGKCPVPRPIDRLDTSRSTLMERRGEGVPIILERSTQLSGHAPLYEVLDESELRLTIFAAHA